MLAVSGINHRSGGAFNSITIGYTWVILLEESNFGIANLYNFFRIMLFEGNLGSKCIEVNREIRLPHLFPEHFFDPFVTPMKNDTVTWSVCRSKEWYSLDVIVMKMGKKDMKGRVADFLGEELFSKYTQARSSIQY